MRAPGRWTRLKRRMKRDAAGVFSILSVLPPSWHPFLPVLQARWPLSTFLLRFFLSLSFCPQFGSRGGKACIIRRNSTGITLQYGSHPVIPLLPFFVEQLIYLIIPLSTDEAAPLLVPRFLSCLIVQRGCFSFPRAERLYTTTTLVANLVRRHRLFEVVEVIV